MKKKKKAKKGEQTKAVNAGLVGFVAGINLTSSETIEEGEDSMYSLASGFATRMHKRAASS